MALKFICGLLVGVVVLLVIALQIAHASHRRRLSPADRAAEDGRIDDDLRIW